MILSISEWWPTLDALEKVYWIIAIPFSVIFILQTIMTLFMGDVTDVDSGGDVDATELGQAMIDSWRYAKQLTDAHEDELMLKQKIRTKM